MWYPCGSFKGDERSKALCSSYTSGGILAGIAKKQLDDGIAGALAQEYDKLVSSIIRGYPHLSARKNELEFGYKIAIFERKEAWPMTVIEPKKQVGLLDNIKNIFSG